MLPLGLSSQPGTLVTFLGPFYWFRLNLIPAWIGNFKHQNVGLNSSHTWLGIWLLTHAGIKVYPWGPGGLRRITKWSSPVKLIFDFNLMEYFLISQKYNFGVYVWAFSYNLKPRLYQRFVMHLQPQCVCVHMFYIFVWYYPCHNLKNGRS